MNNRADLVPVNEDPNPLHPDCDTQNLPVKVGPEFIDGFVPPDYLVDGIIQRRYVYSLTAPTGHGKTALTLHLMFSIAHGEPFAGREVEAGNVLMLAGENPDDVRARTIVSSEIYGLPINNRMIFWPGVFDIEQSMEILERVAVNANGLSLVIVDTAAAFSPTNDENDNMQQRQYAQKLRALCGLNGGPAVIINAHPTKNAQKENLQPRGGGSFIAEMDGGLTLWSEDRGKTSRLHHSGKFRGPGFESIDFENQTHTSEKVADTRGRRLPSVVTVPMTEEKAEAIKKEQIKDQDVILAIMLKQRGRSYAEMARAANWYAESGKEQKSRVEKAIKKLKDHGLVKKGRDDKYRLTESGKKEAEQIWDRFDDENCPI